MVKPAPRTTMLRAASAGWLRSSDMHVSAGLLDSPAEMGVLALAWILTVGTGAAIGYLIGKPKGQETLGLVLGAFLGCIGWLIVAFLPKKPGVGATAPLPPAPAPPSIPPAADDVASEAQWAPDPFGRFEQRYFDGRRWTEHVASQGRQYTDEPSP